MSDETTIADVVSWQIAETEQRLEDLLERSLEDYARQQKRVPTSLLEAIAKTEVHLAALMTLHTRASRMTDEPEDELTQ